MAGRASGHRVGLGDAGPEGGRVRAGDGRPPAVRPTLSRSPRAPPHCTSRSCARTSVRATRSSCPRCRSSRQRTQWCTPGPRPSSPRSTPTTFNLDLDDARRRITAAHARPSSWCTSSAYRLTSTASPRWPRDRGLALGRGRRLRHREQLPGRSDRVAQRPGLLLLPPSQAAHHGRRWDGPHPLRRSGGSHAPAPPARDERLGPRAPHGSDDIVRERYDEVGFNYRMTDVQAAMGIEQLRRLPDIRRQPPAPRRGLRRGPVRRNGGAAPRSCPQTSPGTSRRTPCASTGFDAARRDDVMRTLLRAGIASRPGRDDRAPRAGVRGRTHPRRAAASLRAGERLVDRHPAPRRAARRPIARRSPRRSSPRVESV